MTSPASPAPLANAGPSYRITPTAVVLIAANLVPLAGVLFFGWSVFATLLLFWVENVIVGVFNILRMLTAAPDQLFGGIHTRGFPTAAMFWDAVRGAGIAPAAWGLALSHAVSFAFNYIGAGQYRTASLPMLMARPYGRVAVLHVVIIGGGFLVMALGSPAVALALLVVLKTALDLRAHLREHLAAPQPLPA